MLPSENENSHFILLHCLNITRCIKHGVKHKVHQVSRKQIDSHKVCSKCPPLARTKAHKRVCHWSTASSISGCSKPRHTCSRRCRSSSMSWTLVSYTRCWMTDHSARHVATELNRPQSGGLCHLVCHSAWYAAGNILRVHYKGMKCDVSFSLGSISTLFRWGGHFCYVCVI